MPLYTAPALGLLTGPGDRGAYMIGGSGLDREASNSPRSLWFQTQPLAPVRVLCKPDLRTPGLTLKQLATQIEAKPVFDLRLAQAGGE